MEHTSAGRGISGTNLIGYVTYVDTQQGSISGFLYFSHFLYFLSGLLLQGRSNCLYGNFLKFEVKKEVLKNLFISFLIIGILT